MARYSPKINPSRKIARLSNDVHRKFVLEKIYLPAVGLCLSHERAFLPPKSLIFRAHHNTDCQFLLPEIRAGTDELRSHTTTRLTSLRAGELYMWAINGDWLD